MNKWLILVCLLAFFLPGIAGGDTPALDSTKHYRSFADYRQLQEYLQWTPRKKPLIGAHRGGPEPGYPENCIATFENALTYAPCLIECDVHQSKDGVLIMMHDDTLERTTTGKGRVNDHTFAQLRKLFLKDNDGKITQYRIPTLVEVLKWARGRTIVQLDIKRSVKLAKVLQVVKEQKAEAFTVIITYNLRATKLCYQLHPQLAISANATGMEHATRLLSSGVPHRNLLAFVGIYEPPQEVYTLLHKNGIRPIQGTMHNIDNKALRKGTRVYIALLQNGASILATDNVPLAAKAIQEYLRLK